VLDTNLLVTWYGNPRSANMGVLGRQTGPGERGDDEVRRGLNEVVGEPELGGERLPHSVAAARRSASRVWASSASPWVRPVNHASNWEGGG